MAVVQIDGIATHYEICGEGPPLLMYAPGGFDATMAKWSTQGIYAKIKPVEHLAKHYRCILFDRRECGASGGRIERITFDHYVRQGLGLLDHLGVEKAHLMGGCMGCAPVARFGIMHPGRVMSMVLFWPVGGAKYRMTGQQRFAEHLAFAQKHGLAAVAEIVLRERKSFGGDPRGGPWASVIAHDAGFAESYAAQSPETYRNIVMGFARTMFDRDTAPGAEPEDLLACDLPALIVPGNDASHATSAARYLHECLPKSEYWDAPVASQTEEATSALLLDFLARASPMA